MKKASWLVSVILAIALVFSLPITHADAAASFKVTDLSISPTFISAGSGNVTVTISMRITNTGTESGTYKAELKINDVTEATKDVTLEPGKEQVIMFPVAKTEVGEYKVTIGDLKGVFSVAPANLDVKTLLIDPPEVSPEKEVVISVIVQNKSTDQALSYDSLKLFINGTIEGTKLISLEAGESTTLNFTVSKKDTGNYVVQIGSKTGSFTVKASFLSSFEWWIWAIIGAISIIILIMGIMILTSPKKRKGQITGRPGKTAKGQLISAPVQPIAVQSYPEQRMPSNTFAPEQMPPQAMHQYAGQQQMPPKPMSPLPRQPQQMPQQPSPYPGQPQMPPKASPPFPGQPQQLPQQPSPYPRQQQMPPAKPDQYGAPPAFTPGMQPAFGMSGRHMPQFTVNNLNITPQQVKEGDSISISAVVTNHGTSAGQYSMVLRIGGVVENISEINLNPGASQTGLFTVIKDTPGEYYVEVDGQRGVFNVSHRIPATFNVSNLVITPDRVKQGETISISAIATNTGETTGSYSVVLRIKGIAESIEEVALEPGRSQKVVFSVIKDTAGFYPVALENLSGRFVVEMDWKG
ncbi:CARDB domain-containing protein [Chloroflexota bacterium]